MKLNTAFKPWDFGMNGEMEIKQVDLSDKESLKAILKRLSDGIDKSGKIVLADTSLYAFRQVPMWVGYIDNEPVTINVSYFGRSRKNVWMPYMNEYIAYTRPDVRRRHYALNLIYYIRDLAIKAGCRRLKSLVGTTLGCRFHQRQGDEIWAYTDEHTFLVDTPLVNPDIFPKDTVPIEVRKWAQKTSPLTKEEIEHIIQTTGVKHDYYQLSGR
jgi:hypothetical protein